MPLAGSSCTGLTARCNAQSVMLSQVVPDRCLGVLELHFWSALHVSNVVTLPSSLQVFGLVKSEKQLPDDFYRTKALPIGFLMALSFYLSNVVYLYLTVSLPAPSTCFTCLPFCNNSC